MCGFGGVIMEIKIGDIVCWNDRWRMACHGEVILIQGDYLILKYWTRTGKMRKTKKNKNDVQLMDDDDIPF